jgi:hypothetical protein
VVSINATAAAVALPAIELPAELPDPRRYPAGGVRFAARNKAIARNVNSVVFW